MVISTAKYMREMGLDARLKKKFKIKTTDSNHSGPIAPRVFKVEEGIPDGPNHVLAGDITLLETWFLWPFKFQISC